MSIRKPHQDFAGYVCELRNRYSGGHTVISDCKRAADEGNAIVENYVEEGGRWLDDDIMGRFIRTARGFSHSDADALYGHTGVARHRVVPLKVSGGGVVAHALVGVGYGWPRGTLRKADFPYR